MDTLDFMLSEEQKMLRKMVRDFANEKLAPIADEVDQKEEFPANNFKMMADLGLYGITIPPEYGGSGGDFLSYAMIVEELARACAATSNIFHPHHSSIMNINWFGTEEQKQKYLRPLIKGEMIGAGAITEPEAGSDVSGLKTTAVRDGDYYVINGTKTFISLGPVCDICSVVTRIPGMDGKHEMTILLVEDGTPGFIKGKTFKKLGIRGSVTSELTFEDCRVPVANRLGDEGMGFKNTMKILDYTRIGIAAEALGVAQAALEMSIEYAKQRIQFKRPIAEHQAIAFMVADMATELEAARMVNYEAALMADRGVRYSKQSAMAKLLASECAMKAATNGIQIFGGYGYMMDSPIQRVFRDAKVMTIFEGTSQIQRIVISRLLLRD